MIQLRNYQTESIVQLREGFKTNQRQVLCLPTGAGKTVVFSEMVRLASEKGTVTIVLTDRTELFKQTIKALGKIGVAVEEIAPHKKNVFTQATIYLAMIETIKRRSELLNTLQPNLIIIDEAHKGNFTKILDLFPNAKVIGATATPVGKHFHKYYTSIVQNIDVPELVENKFLVPCKPFQMVDDFSDLETKMGEFTEQSLDMHFNKPTLYDGVIENWERLAKGKKTLVFNCNISHAVAINEAFISAGISSECITHKTTKQERERILNAFTSGSFTVLNNCGILTTGYDEPSIECVIVNRATKSLPLWLQCVGRGSRLYPNKEFFTLLDFGGNHTRLGLWNEPRVWDLKEKKKREGIAPVKSCPSCEAMLPASVPFCSFCNFEFPPPEKSEPKNGVMIEVQPFTPSHLIGKRISDLSIQELIELQQSKKYKASYIWRVIRSNGHNDIDQYAKEMGYSKGWIYRQKQETENNFTNYKL